MLVSDGRYAHGAFAHAQNLLHVPIRHLVGGDHVYEGFHIQNVNGYTSRYREWLRVPSFAAERCLQVASAYRSTMKVDPTEQIRRAVSLKVLFSLSKCGLELF